MFMLNQFKKNLFILTAFVGFLGISQVSYGNGEISVHFGKKFQEDGAWHFGVDGLYRMSINENSSFGIGPRYRFHLKGESNSSSATTVGTTFSTSTSRKYNNHRLTLLTNYRYEMMESLFMGAILGIDVWKYLSIGGEELASDGGNSNADITSSEFLWNNFTAQLGIEIGYKITPNLLMKLEGGYDLLSFKKCSVSISGNVNGNANRVDCGVIGEAFDGVYATVGVGYHF